MALQTFGQLISHYLEQHIKGRASHVSYQCLNRQLLSPWWLHSDEGYTASGYISFLLRNDFRARRETGWVAGKGWPPREEWEARFQRGNTPPAKGTKRKP